MNIAVVDRMHALKVGSGSVGDGGHSSRCGCWRLMIHGVFELLLNFEAYYDGVRMR